MKLPASVVFRIAFSVATWDASATRHIRSLEDAHGDVAKATSALDNHKVQNAWSTAISMNTNRKRPLQIESGNA
jgi:hypothetical protein